MRYRLSELADQDLLETWLYVAAEGSVERADKLLEAIGQSFELLAEQPRMGRRRPEFGPDVRSFVVEKHVVYYRPEKELLIARVLYGTRDQAAAWQKAAEDDQRER